MTNPTLYRFDNNNAQESKECDVQRLAKRMSFFGKTKINHRLRVAAGPRKLVDCPDEPGSLGQSAFRCSVRLTTGQDA
jgi:hypothetical protein